MAASTRWLPILFLSALLFVASATTGALAGAVVTSADIKNGTIKIGDLNKSTIKKLKGQNGAPGAPGAPGSALAYARVAASGAVDANASRSLVLKSLVNSGGYYCLDYTGGTPKAVIVSVDNVGSSYTFNNVSATTDPATLAFHCPGAGGSSDIFVEAVDVTSGLHEDTPFYIAVIA